MSIDGNNHNNEPRPISDASFERKLFSGAAALLIATIIGGSIARRRVEKSFGLKALFPTNAKQDILPYFTDPQVYFSHGSRPRAVENILRSDIHHQTFDLSAGLSPSDVSKFTRYSQRITPTQQGTKVEYAALAFSKFQSDLKIDVRPLPDSQQTQVVIIGHLVAPSLLATSTLENFQREEQTRLESIERVILSDSKEN